MLRGSAAAQAQSRLAGHQVLLETDDSQGRLDKYGRELVYLWIDGQLFNLEMIKAGFAHEYTYDAPFRYQEQFRAAEQAAAASGAGLWSRDTCGGDITNATRRLSWPKLDGPQSGTDRGFGTYGTTRRPLAGSALTSTSSEP